jgi:hypothetical protein
MRYQTWGIPRLVLLGIALVPAFFWVGFRVLNHPELSWNSGYLYFRDFIWVWGSILTLSTFIWVYVFRRGVFQARWLAYAFMGAGVFYEVWQSVQARGLLHLSLSLVYFLVVMTLARRLDRWVEMAAFNPRITWFEGQPKAVPQVKVEVRVGAESEWLAAQMRRIDREGVFLLTPEGLANSKVRQKVQFRLNWKTHSVEGEGKLLSIWKSGTRVGGMGLLFLPKGMYHRIQYTALVEALRGEGYAI